MLTQIVLYSVTVLLVFGGIVVLHVAAFADRSRGRPRCPECWHDMTGSRGFVCPECGHDAARAANLYRTRRHGMRAVLGMLLVVSGLSLGAVPTVQEQGWTALIPTTGLMVVLPWTDNEWVFEEVDARVTATNPKWFVRRRGEQDISTMTIFYAQRCAALLRSRRPDSLRLKAAQTLYDLSVRDAKVEQALIEATSDRDGAVRVQALSTLAHMAYWERVVDADACARAAMRCLREPRSMASAMAARFLREVDPPPSGVLPELIAALEDEDSQVRGDACLILSRLEAQAQPAVPVLVRLIDDPSQRVSRLAINTLSRIGDGAAPAVEPILRAAHWPDQRGAMALEALARLGLTAAPAVPGLTEIMLGGHESHWRRTAAAAALLAINPYDPSLLDAIERATQEDIRPLRLLIAEQITRARTNEPQQVRIVLGFLASEFPEVRQEAALALGRFAPLRPHEVDRLTTCASDPAFIGQEEAQIALSRVLEQATIAAPATPAPPAVDENRSPVHDPEPSGG